MGQIGHSIWPCQPPLLCLKRGTMHGLRLRSTNQTKRSASIQKLHSSFEWKKLSTHSHWDLEHVLHTMDPYWVFPMKIFPLAASVLEPDDAVINFTKSEKNKNLTPLWVGKTLLLFLSSVSKIYLGCAILDIWIFGLQQTPFLYCSEVQVSWRQKSRYPKWCIQEIYRPKNLEITEGVFNQKISYDLHGSPRITKDL